MNSKKIFFNQNLVVYPDCPKACEYRCSKTHHRKPCLFFCNYCCQRCLCVPSRFYGNREECPCYNNIKTKEGKNKCP
nr:GASA protein [Gossypium barbadense]